MIPSSAPDPREQVSILTHYRRLLKKGFYREALRHLQKILSEKSGSFQLWLEYGHINRRLSRFDEAISAYQRAWELGFFREDREIEVLLGLSGCYRGLGQFPRAQVYLQEAEERIRSLKWRSLYPFYFWNLGVLRRQTGDLSGAESALKRGLFWAKKLGDRESQAYLLSARGGLYRVRGEFSSSLRSYRKAHEFFEELSDPFGLAYTSCGIGNALRMLGEFSEAGGYLRRAYELYRVQGDEGSLAYTLFSLATVKKLEGGWDKARNLFLKAKKIFERCRDRRGKAYAELGLLEIRGLEEGGSSSLLHQLTLFSRELENEGLPLESAYARLIQALLGEDEKALLKVRRRLRRLGTRWFSTSLPLNIP